MFDVWKNILAEIEQVIPSNAFTVYFKDVELISILDGKVKIGTKNIFTVKQIEKKYDKVVRDALQHNGIQFDEIEYIVSTKNKTKKRSREVGTHLNETKKLSDLISRPQPTTSYTPHTFSTGLKPEYTMENFVTGSNNDLAVSVAKNVIEFPGQKYNPFFLYGGPGLGKTHLVQAIGNELIKRNPKLKVLYTPTDHFYSEFISAIKKGTGDAFSQKYRKLDVLIIDDFQQIIKKDRSQEEFFNIFNDLHQNNRQIIVTSDRLPQQIATLDERLSSRLAMAGAIDLQMPNFEDKCAILKSMAEYLGAEIEDEAIEYIAENVKTNIRELGGELKHLLAIAELKNIPPIEVIQSGFVENTSSARKGAALSPKKVVEKVAKFYELTPKELCSKNRTAHIKNARQVAMYILSDELGLSTTKIAAEVGVKDHTTVMHGIKRVKNDLKLNFGLREQISVIRERLYD